MCLSSGCAGSVCRPTCEKIYGADEGQCNIQVPGHVGEDGRAELIDQCMSMCQDAASQPGDVGAYDPNVRASGADDVVLENKAQVQLWSDCIEETACSDIDIGYCAPLW